MDITTLAVAKAYTDEQVEKVSTGGVDLSGYYTREEIDAMDYNLKNNLESQILAIPKFSVRVVDELPTENISITTVYLLKDTETDGNLYTEYIYINNTWEILGSQQIDLTDYVKSEDVSTEIEAALAEAKASGEFDGADGQNGKDGINGQDGADGLSAYQIWLNAGNTGTEAVFLASLKGADGAKGDKGDKGDTGANGTNGKDGVSATHSWNGTTLTIISASGTSSANLKGDKGDPYTLTEADKAEIVAMVIESLGGNPVFGYVDENNNIIVSGNLADGSYNIKYEMEDGSTVDIGDLVLDSNVYYSVTNNLTNCTNSNSAVQVVEGESYSATITAKSGYELKSVSVTMGGSPVTVSGGNINIANVTGDIVITAVAEEAVVAPSYTNLADPTSADWKEGYRLTTNIDNVTALAGGVATNYIAVQNGDLITCEGINFEDTNNRIAHSDGANGESIHGIGKASVYATTNVTNGYFKDVTYDANSITLTITCVTQQMRFSGLATGTSNDVVVKIKRNGEWL